MAFAEWNPLAKEGNAEAQFNLGRLYANGDGVSRDYKVAFTWFEAAAKQGHRKAQLALARMFRYGDGVEKNLESAKFWESKEPTKESDRQPNATPASKDPPTQLSERPNPSQLDPTTESQSQSQSFTTINQINPVTRYRDVFRKELSPYGMQFYRECVGSPGIKEKYREFVSRKIQPEVTKMGMLWGCYCQGALLSKEFEPSAEIKADFTEKQTGQKPALELPATRTLATTIVQRCSPISDALTDDQLFELAKQLKSEDYHMSDEDFKALIEESNIEKTRRVASEWLKSSHDFAESELKGEEMCPLVSAPFQIISVDRQGSQWKVRYVKNEWNIGSFYISSSAVSGGNIGSDHYSVRWTPCG